MKKRLNLLLVIFLFVSFIPLLANGEAAVPIERQLPRLIDSAGLLTNEEVEKLTEKLDEISKRQNFDVIIVTVDSLKEGYTSTEYADDFYDFNGFGMGNNYDGILLLISVEKRDWAISTHGYGITVFTDAGQKYMVDNFIVYLRQGKYYKAFDKFAYLSDDFITQAKTDKPYDSNNLPKKPMSPIWILVSILGGTLIAFVITEIMKRNLKSVSKQRGASKYIVDTVMSPFANKDLFLYSIVTKREKPKERNLSSTGTTIHKSSSGRSHGGSRGKF
ncbi:MAG: TPM domain-containing protein [Clostridium sp.]|nr:TPM domain-containing protein [Clostridium sp.]